MQEGVATAAKCCGVAGWIPVVGGAACAACTVGAVGKELVSGGLGTDACNTIWDMMAHNEAGKNLALASQPKIRNFVQGVDIRATQAAAGVYGVLNDRLDHDELQKAPHSLIASLLRTWAPDVQFEKAFIFRPDLGKWTGKGALWFIRDFEQGTLPYLAVIQTHKDGTRTLHISIKGTYSMGTAIEDTKGGIDGFDTSLFGDRKIKVHPGFVECAMVVWNDLQTHR